MTVFPVHMLAYMPGETRPVSIENLDLPIPDDRDGDSVINRVVNSAVHGAGQNRLNRNPEYLSVTVGDVIEWPSRICGRPRFWDIVEGGFREITREDLDGLLESGEARAMSAAVSGGLGSDPLAGFDSRERLVLLDLVLLPGLDGLLPRGDGFDRVALVSARRKALALAAPVSAQDGMVDGELPGFHDQG